MKLTIFADITEDPSSTNFPTQKLGELDLSIPSTIINKYIIEEDDSGEWRKLGAGRFSDVYLGHAVQQEHEKVAIKVLAPFLKGSKVGEDVARRESIPEKLNHINIIKIIHTAETISRQKVDLVPGGEEYVIKTFVLEYCKYDLPTFIGKENPQSQARLNLLLQLARAMDYLYGERILHRDLKPQNLLVMKNEESNILKLIDFNVAERVSDQSTQLKHTAGTRPWMAPELFQKGEGHSFPADVFAAALVFLATMVCRVECKDQDCKICKHLCMFEGTFKKCIICHFNRCPTVPAYMQDNVHKFQSIISQHLVVQF